MKRLRDENGNKIQPTNSPCGVDRSQTFEEQKWVRVPFRFADCGVVDIGTLTQRLADALPGTDMTPAAFAYQMVEGVPKVRFTINTSS